MNSRRLFLGLLPGLMTLAGCTTGPSPQASPSLPEPRPIVFVHGNGDTAALWQTTIWRFESNGWPRERLHAIDLPYPLARDDDTKAQPGRTSTAEHMAYLKGEVEKVLRNTGARQVVLVGNSRGGYAIRNYIQNGGGDKMAFDGQTPPPGAVLGAGVASSKIKPAGLPRTVTAEFNGERVTGRSWPASENHVSILELTY